MMMSVFVMMIVTVFVQMDMIVFVFVRRSQPHLALIAFGVHDDHAGRMAEMGADGSLIIFRDKC